jgi:hypothetical protein
MIVEEDTRSRARDRLIRERFIPAIEHQRTHVSIKSREIEDLYDGIDPKFILDGLGPGWWLPKRMGEGKIIIFVCDISRKQAIHQINDRLNQKINY